MDGNNRGNDPQDVPKIYVALMGEGIRINYTGFPNLLSVKLALLGAVEGIEAQMARNSVVQRKSDIILPTDMLK